MPERRLPAQMTCAAGQGGCGRHACLLFSQNCPLLRPALFSVVRWHPAHQLIASQASVAHSWTSAVPLAVCRPSARDVFSPQLVPLSALVPATLPNTDEHVSQTNTNTHTRIGGAFS